MTEIFGRKGKLDESYRISDNVIKDLAACFEGKVFHGRNSCGGSLEFLFQTSIAPLEKIRETTRFPPRPITLPSPFDPTKRIETRGDTWVKMTRAFPFGTHEIPIVSTCFQHAWASIEDGVLFSKDILCAHCVPGTQDSPQLPISFHSTENRFGLIITESQDIGLSGSFSFIVVSTSKLRNRVSSYLRLREKRIQCWGIFINISWDIISTKQRAFDQPFFRLRSSQENLIRWGTIAWKIIDTVFRTRFAVYRVRI